MQYCIESLDLLNLDQETKLRPSSMCVCVCVCVCKKTSPLQWKPTKQTKKPVSVYLLSDFTANQKLHRIYFVQGKKPFKYLEYNS